MMQLTLSVGKENNMFKTSSLNILLSTKIMYVQNKVGSTYLFSIYPSLFPSFNKAKQNSKEGHLVFVMTLTLFSEQNYGL